MASLSGAEMLSMVAPPAARIRTMPKEQRHSRASVSPGALKRMVARTSRSVRVTNSPPRHARRRRTRRPRVARTMRRRLCSEAGQAMAARSVTPWSVPRQEIGGLAVSHSEVGPLLSTPLWATARPCALGPTTGDASVALLTPHDARQAAHQQLGQTIGRHRAWSPLAAFGRLPAHPERGPAGRASPRNMRPPRSVSPSRRGTDGSPGPAQVTSH